MLTRKRQCNDGTVSQNMGYGLRRSKFKTEFHPLLTKRLALKLNIENVLRAEIINSISSQILYFKPGAQGSHRGPAMEQAGCGYSDSLERKAVHEN